MFTISHTIFGNYVDVAWTSTAKQAMKEVKKLSNEGWLNIRVINQRNEEIYNSEKERAKCQ